MHGGWPYWKADVISHKRRRGAVVTSTNVVVTCSIGRRRHGGRFSRQLIPLRRPPTSRYRSPTAPSSTRPVGVLPRHVPGGSRLKDATAARACAVGRPSFFWFAAAATVDRRSATLTLVYCRVGRRVTSDRFVSATTNLGETVLIIPPLNDTSRCINAYALAMASISCIPITSLHFHCVYTERPVNGIRMYMHAWSPLTRFALHKIDKAQ